MADRPPPVNGGRLTSCHAVTISHFAGQIAGPPTAARLVNMQIHNSRAKIFALFADKVLIIHAPQQYLGSSTLGKGARMPSLYFTDAASASQG